MKYLFGLILLIWSHFSFACSCAERSKEGRYAAATEVIYVEIQTTE